MRLCIHLNLQLAHSDRQVEDQLSDVLQLALQQLDGLGLPLILRVNNKTLELEFPLEGGVTKPNNSFTLSAHLLLCDPGGVLEFNDGLVERLLHLLHLFSISAAQED